jgi:hypothetical protein
MQAKDTDLFEFDQLMQAARRRVLHLILLVVAAMSLVSVEIISHASVRILPELTVGSWDACSSASWRAGGTGPAAGPSSVSATRS